jgi:hypothetical protein
MNAETKPCRRCGRELPLDSFRSDKRSRNGRASSCKACDEAARGSGVPVKLTDEKVAKYLEARRTGSTRIEAARHIGVTPDALRRRRLADPVFAAQELDAEDDACDQLVRVMWDRAMAGDRVLLMFLAQNLSGGAKAATLAEKPRFRDMRSVQKSVVHSGTVELEAGPALERIKTLQATLEARAKVKGPAELELPVLDAEVVEDQ